MIGPYNILCFKSKKREIGPRSKLKSLTGEGERISESENQCPNFKAIFLFFKVFLPRMICMIELSISQELREIEHLNNNNTANC